MTPYQIKKFLSSMFQSTSPPTPFQVCPLFCHSLSLELSGIDFHHLTPPTPPSKNHPPNTRDIFVRCFIPLPLPRIFSLLYIKFPVVLMSLCDRWRGEGKGDISSFFQSIRKIQNKSKERDIEGNSGGCFTFCRRLVFFS